MQYKCDNLLKEDPVIHSLIVQGELKGKTEGEIKGLQDAILDIVSDRFSPEVVEHVQQAIGPSKNVQQLRKFLRQMFQVSNEQEVDTLLSQCFPLPGEIKGIQDSILAFVSDRFSPDVVEHVQQAIGSSQDIQQLKKFLRQLFRVTDGREVYTQLAEYFPTS